MSDNRTEIIYRYDSLIIGSNSKGMTYQEAIDAITAEKVDRFSGSLISGLDVHELIYDSVRYHVQTTRAGRRQSLKDLFNDLGDKMDYPDGAKEQNKAHNRLIKNFGRGFPLGSADGKDKVLGLWTVDDVYEAIESRADNVARQRAAFVNFDRAANRAIAALKSGVEWA